MKCLPVVVLALGLSVCTVASAGDATIHKLQQKIAHDDFPEQVAASLVGNIGPRFAGSASYDAAVIWALQAMQAAGLKNVHVEPVTLPHWVRGKTEVLLELSSTDEQPLAAVALGGSVGTEPQGVAGEVVRVASLAELQALPVSRVRGRIVFIDRHMQRTRDVTGYAEDVAIRVQGPAEAGRKGAVAALIRTVGTADDDVPHTGVTRYGDAPKIPALALSNVAADRLAAITRTGSATIRVKLDAREYGAVNSSQVVGELPGKTDEIVLLGAHLDSWDITPGAEDDAAGVATVLSAVRAINKYARQPQRTIRVVLFADEEFHSSGSRAYVAEHADELGKHVLAMEADLGSGAVWRLGTNLPDSAEDFRKALLVELAPLGVYDGPRDAGGGSDVDALTAAAGVPTIGPQQDAVRYFDVHHSTADTLDHLDHAGLRQNVQVYATAAWLAANWKGDLGKLPVEKAP
ncbi:M20/M25/M40 family metallo-hydrolase [Solimonas marina]|uniref:Carboxypeptidase Q n=1 Tax=Solimonas marina TaxID=2714601 RepID=A0A969W954_9GAMM|nr:M20/M25/M40 family metallo-hydrolase [Solimonas marina]NKF21820.1 M20/M25/M40 family metallo-hydrolase [Solimonas marina]